jgi:hypothetical protein
MRRFWLTVVGVVLAVTVTGCTQERCLSPGGGYEWYPAGSCHTAGPDTVPVSD